MKVPTQSVTNLCIFCFDKRKWNSISTFP